MRNKILAVVVAIAGIGAAAAIPGAAQAGSTATSPSTSCPAGATNSAYCIKYCPSGTLVGAYCESGTGSTISAASSTVAAPVLGKSADIARTSGTVEVELPGTHKFVLVSSSEQIPLGAVIDATHGMVKVTIALPGGGSSTAIFWAGVFTLVQSANGSLMAKLVDGSYAGCPTPAKKHRHSDRSRSAHEIARGTKTKKKPGTSVDSLWASAKGNYTTSGRDGAAAVLGTEWLTRDQCDGTFFSVLKTTDDPQGEIRVTVLHPYKHTVLLKRGHYVLARAPGYA
jgi:hypothetical protein